VFLLTGLFKPSPMFEGKWSHSFKTLFTAQGIWIKRYFKQTL